MASCCLRKRASWDRGPTITSCAKAGTTRSFCFAETIKFTSNHVPRWSSTTNNCHETARINLEKLSAARKSVSDWRRYERTVSGPQTPVIPVKTGIQTQGMTDRSVAEDGTKTTRTRLSSCGVEEDWIPACAGMTSEAGVMENGGSKQR